MNSSRILVIEDEKNIAKLIRYNLEKAGFLCECVVTGEDGLAVLDRQKVDAVILDVMLPKMDGFEVCRAIKQNEMTRAIPVLMLTARGEEVDRIVGLELGADDYIVKPFSPRELILRVKAVLRRHKPAESRQDIFTGGPITMNIPRHRVTVEDRPVHLTVMEFKLLTVFLKRKGRVQSRQQLLEDVWDMNADVTTRTVDAHIKSLRQKLGQAGGPWIETIRGHGYRFRDEDDM